MRQTKAPARPSLDDARQPTNPDLWRKVLDVASGERRSYEGIGGRTIHAPNEGHGFRKMPHNPMGIAWAVKQYNAYGGGWEPQKTIQAQALVADTIWVDSPAQYRSLHKEALLSRVEATSPQLVLGGAVADCTLTRVQGIRLASCPDTLDLQVVAQEKAVLITGTLASQGGMGVPLKTLGLTTLVDCIFHATGDRVANLALGRPTLVGGGITVPYATSKGSGTLRVVLASCQPEGRTGLVPTVTCTPDACQIPLLTASRVAERFSRDS